MLISILPNKNILKNNISEAKIKTYICRLNVMSLFIPSFVRMNIVHKETEVQSQGWEKEYSV